MRAPLASAHTDQRFQARPKPTPRAIKEPSTRIRDAELYEAAASSDEEEDERRPGETSMQRQPKHAQEQQQPAGTHRQAKPNPKTRTPATLNPNQRCGALQVCGRKMTKTTWAAKHAKAGGSTTAKSSANRSGKPNPKPQTHTPSNQGTLSPNQRRRALRGRGIIR